MEFILASASPRRKELLKKVIDDFKIIPSSLDESLFPLEELSKEKAMSIAINNKDAVVIGADTVVILDDKILGKPHTEENAYSMLKALSNKTHQVITYYSICHINKGICYTDKCVSNVTFFTLSEELINAYIKTGSPLDKAGAYGIQDKEFKLVKEYSNEEDNIIGLPTQALKKALTNLGLIL